jgi:glycosyltransferase involved in cell wall biosynthesis
VNPTIWCIVPFSRPQYAQTIFQRFAAQTYPNKKLVLVENGDGEGTCQRLNLKPDLLLTSGKHQSWAKNEGILKLRALGHTRDFWTTWDDDDYYGPRYLEELAENLHKGDVIGKSKSFIKLSDDNLYLIDTPPENVALDDKWVVHGPTITARVGESLLFEHQPFAEDLKFVDEMRLQGAKIYVTSRYNWCYRRNASSNHTWQISDDEFKYANSGSFINYGPFDEDVVNGKKEVEGEIVWCNDVNLRNSLIYKEVLKNTGGPSEQVLDALAQQVFSDETKTPTI